MTDSMKILVVSGSIRSNSKHTRFIEQTISEVRDLAQYIERVTGYQKENNSISNSDLLAGAVLLGIKADGSLPGFFPLVNLFPKKDQNVSYLNNNAHAEITFKDSLSLHHSQFKELKEQIDSSAGVVLATPVYFGDRSSVANKILQLSGIHNLLKDKLFGAVSVGAKRNGGQETAIIYSLYEALNQNAMVVGNGPPTSQYGGTGVGGKRGTVINDSWGLETAFGTGRRISQVSRIVNNGNTKEVVDPVKILVLATMDDTKQSLYSYLSKFLEEVNQKVADVEFQLVNVLDKTIHRCLGCEECPGSGLLEPGETPRRDHHARCIISDKDDDMLEIHEQMLQADGIVIAGINVSHHEELVYRYQVLMERTRYIRRDHFELTNKLMTSFTLSQVGAKINALHGLKTVTSYIRHNLILHKPVEAYFFEGKILHDGMDDFLHFVEYSKIIKAGKIETEVAAPEYHKKGIGGY